MYYGRRYDHRYDGFFAIIAIIFFGMKFILMNGWLPHILWGAVVLVILVLIGKFLFTDLYYKIYGINLVAKNLVFDKHTIYNGHCTVKYTPDERIVILENVADSKNEKRTFTLSKANQVKINKCWYDICNLFDSYTAFDTLEKFFEMDTNIKVVKIKSKVKEDIAKKPKTINIDTTGNDPKFTNMEDITPDNFGLTASATKYVENFVNMNNIEKQESKSEANTAQPEFVNMEDALSAGPNKQININIATAGEIAILPGINIVMAKKIVEYRNINGTFKSVDDFIKVANVKEHFVEKIKKMINLSVPAEKKDSGNDDDSGRIVDI